MTLPDFLTQDADGEIRLTGHRIGLYTVVCSRREGRSAEQIAEAFPSLAAELVRTVLAYYQANRAEVDAYVDAYRADLERQEAAHLPGPGAIRLRQLRDRLRQADARRAADPGWTSLSVVEKLRRLGLENTSGAP